MGVPALFRWLHKKYPKIITPVVEEQPYEVDGHQYSVDTTRPNPNGEEFDNLYLDFNNIVHPCSHPENKPPPATESEMMMEIFKYTDRVVNMVRPRKLLLIAIGTLAPQESLGKPFKTPILSSTIHASLMGSIISLHFLQIVSSWLTLFRWCCSSCEDEPTTSTTFSICQRC